MRVGLGGVVSYRRAGARRSGEGWSAGSGACSLHLAPRRRGVRASTAPRRLDVRAVLRRLQSTTIQAASARGSADPRRPLLLLLSLLLLLLQRRRPLRWRHSTVMGAQREEGTQPHAAVPAGRRVAHWAVRQRARSTTTARSAGTPRVRAALTRVGPRGRQPVGRLLGRRAQVRSSSAARQKLLSAGEELPSSSAAVATVRWCELHGWMARRVALPVGCSEEAGGSEEARDSHRAETRAAAVPGACLGAASALGTTCAVDCGARGRTEGQAKAGRLYRRSRLNSSRASCACAKA